MSLDQSHNWPILTRYDQDHLARIALPLGGIGTGTISLGGRGDLRQWEVMNRPSKNFTPRHAFFALRTHTASGQTITKALEGPLEPHFEGPDGCTAPNAGLPRFRHCEFHAAYPFGQVLLNDPSVPLSVRLQAFNPLIPADADRSGIPAAILRYTLTNPTHETVSASVCGSVPNFIGKDGAEGAPKQNENIFQALTPTSPLQGLLLHSNGVSPHAAQYGTMALSTTSTTGVTYRQSWLARWLTRFLGRSL